MRMTALLLILTAISLCGCKNAEKDKTNAFRTSNLRYYGHFWVESKSFGSHLEKVSKHCNIHWVESINDLKKCSKLKERCILQVRWEFFRDRTKDGTTPLAIDYQQVWNQTANKLEPYLESVEAFYMQDEPYWSGVSPVDLDKAIACVKQTFPNKPVMVVFATPSLTNDFVVPKYADWLGFNAYKDINEVKHYLNFLRGKLNSNQSLFLVPQSFLNEYANNDEALAELNWAYFDIAKSEPKVIGLLNFGLFSHAKDTDLPLTVKAQSIIGKTINIWSQSQ